MAFKIWMSNSDNIENFFTQISLLEVVIAYILTISSLSIPTNEITQNREKHLLLIITNLPVSLLLSYPINHVLPLLFEILILLYLFQDHK